MTSMKLQIIRKNGKVKGIALIFGDGYIVAAEAEKKPWRICDECLERKAILFCRSHSKYVCAGCVRTHRGCQFISVSAARWLVSHARKWEEITTLP